MKRSLADTSIRSTAGTIHSFVLYSSYFIMLIYIYLYTRTCSIHTEYRVFSPRPHLLSGLAWVICFIAAQGKILNGVRGLIAMGNVSFTGLRAGQRAGHINSVRQWLICYVFTKCNSYECCKIIK